MDAYSLINPLTADNLIELLHDIINGLIRLAIPVAIIMLIWAAVLYMTSAGSNQIQKATKALIWTVVGFGVLLISSGIIAIIQDFLQAGLQCDLVAGVEMGTCPTDDYICQDINNSGKGICIIPGEGPTTFARLLELLTDLSGWMLAFTLAGGVVMIIISGASYVMARGDTGKAGKATQMLMYSIIGIAIAALAWAIVNIVSDFLTGDKIFGTLIPNAMAAPPIPPDMPVNAPPGGPQTLGELLALLSRLSGWMFAFVLVMAVGAIIYGGFTYLFSKGDAKAAEKGLYILMYALMGVVIAGMAWAFINITGNLIFGQPLINTPTRGVTCSGSTPVNCFTQGVNACYTNVAQCTASGCPTSNCVQ